ncbi:hypothetical protein ABN09_15220, partial [Morganella morganii]
LSTTRLVNNLLDMARIQSGGFNLNKEWLPLEEVIGSALQMLKPRFDTDSVQIDLNDPMQLICADGPLFERVLINLLENAIKYAGPQAQIGIRSRLSDNMIDIEVWDKRRGPGSCPVRGQSADIENSRADRKNPPSRASASDWLSAGRLRKCTAALFWPETATGVAQASISVCPVKIRL